MHGCSQIRPHQQSRPRLQILILSTHTNQTNKKLFGKDLPIKPLPVLIEYNNTIINSIGRYMDFFRKIRDAKDN